MSAPITAREEILGRIRAALPGASTGVEASHAVIARDYARNGTLDRRPCLALFIDRLVDYDTQVVELTDEMELAGAIEDVLREAAEDRLLVPATFPQQWLPRGAAVEVDHNLTTEQMERAQAVLTTCEAAVASTGTIILVHDGAQGRRAITLLPDHHLCVVRRDQVYELVPEALAAMAEQSARPITTISGPSATSDIEMTRIRGVHGPRRLTVLLYGRL
jgi:L-lactate dehydrogenase complex protein LldG